MQGKHRKLFNAAVVMLFVLVVCCVSSVLGLLAVLAGCVYFGLFLCVSCVGCLVLVLCFGWRAAPLLVFSLFLFSLFYK